MTGFTLVIFAACTACVICAACTGYARANSSSATIEFGMFAVLVTAIVSMGFWRYKTMLMLNRQLAEQAEERKLVEEKISKAKKDWERTFDAITDPIMIVDKDHRIIRANKAMADKLGVALPEVAGLLCYQAVHGAKEPPSFCPYTELLADGRPHSMEIHEERLGGDYLISVSPLYSADGKLNGSVHYARNITERKQAEETVKEYNVKLEAKVRERTKELEQSRQEIEQARLQAEAANRAKTDFLANMSHELRTPLNSVLGFSEILHDELIGKLSKKQKGYVNNIYSSGKHLLSLINDILDLAKVESGRLELELSHVLLKDVFRTSLMMLREKATLHGISMTFDGGPDADIEFVADERKLKQILFNLLSNAVKFTPNGGSVHVNARRVRSGKEVRFFELSTPHSELDTDLVEISVADSGIGIRQADMDKLFKPFFQLESAYTKTYEGTGLGLAITKKLVEFLGGTIRVESEFGKGSRFSFVLPLRQQH
jgi:PAS domain S-box-containing protein